MSTRTKWRLPRAFNSLHNRALATVLMVAVSALSVACGAGDGEMGDGQTAPGSGGVAGQPVVADVQRIFPDSRVYAAEDLKAAGMKVLNEYEVKEFPGAITAYHGAFNQVEYEVRFYASHTDAVDLGAGPADEVSGPDAVVTGDNVKYQEGVTHRRLCSRAAQTPHSGCSYSARYGDYIIKGNMVLLCEGLNSENAMAACNDLLKGVPPR